MTSILIVAGEQSGERYGAGLMREFKLLRPSTRFFGIGGSGMAEEGADLIFSIKDLALVGVFEIIAHIPRLFGILRRLEMETRSRRPAAAVLIDSPDFNLRLARRLKRLGIPILYYVSPTVWAWRRSRLRSIRRLIHRMLLIFPFEEKIYSDSGIPATFVGHPLLDRIPDRTDKATARRRHGLDPTRPLIALLPGSRPSEIRFHMPILMAAAQDLILRRDVECALILADNLDQGMVVDRIPPEIRSRVRLISKDGIAVLAAADAALSACGTANLEAALLEIPVAAFYRISPLTYALGMRMVRIRRYSIVNILAGRDLIPELIQRNFTPARLNREAEALLDSKSRREDMIKGFREIRRALGSRRASKESARQLERLLQDSP